MQQSSDNVIVAFRIYVTIAMTELLFPMFDYKNSLYFDDTEKMHQAQWYQAHKQ
jgi:hypothetical protein